MHSVVSFFLIVVLMYLLYVVSKIPTVQKFFGITKQVQEKTAVNILIFTAVYIVFIWSLLAVLEYYFLNDLNKPLIDFFKLTNNPNRILSRIVMISSLLLAGVIISKVFSRLYGEQLLLKENAENLRITLDSIGDGVIATDTNGNITQMNPVAQKLTGWSLTQAKGKALEEVFNIVDAKTDKQALNPIKKVLLDNQIVTLSHETVLISQDGSRYCIGDSASPILDKDNKIIGVVLVFRNTTKENMLLNQVKESESRWQFALEGSKNGVWDWNTKTNKLFFSKRWKAMLGYQEDEISDDIIEWSSRVHPDDLDRCLKDLDNFLKDDIEFYENTHRLRCKDGSYKWILDRGKIVSREKGKPTRAIGTHSDITDIIKTKEELRKKEELMIAQSRHAAMGEMISMIAHQWRQPLSVIAMASNNLIVDIELGMVNNEVVKNNTQLIKNQTQELSKTINDFKNFFKPQKTIEEIYVKDIFEEAFKVIGKALQNSDIDVIKKYECKKKIQTYSRELMQVFINMLKNAKEALESENIADKKISIFVNNKEDSINISICDNAGGIKQEHISEIFNPYFSTKDEKIGTGLGLYISKIIIEKHLKGTLNVYNKDGGACFEMQLPYKINAKHLS